MQLDKIRQMLPQAQREALPGELPDAVPVEDVETVVDETAQKTIDEAEEALPAPPPAPAEVEGAPVEAPVAE